MKTFDANIHLADYYFSMLNSLSDKANVAGRRSNKTRFVCVSCKGNMMLLHGID